MHVLYFIHCMVACSLQFFCTVERCILSCLYAFTFFSFVLRSPWIRTSVSVTLFMWSYMFCIFLCLALFLCPDVFLLFLSDSGRVWYCHFLHHQSKVVLWERDKNRDSVRDGIKECGHSLIANRVSFLQACFSLQASVLLLSKAISFV